MNGSLYISFFQGQLESALEQVVQLAVTEITGTVGATLGSMLLETARKEQENQRLRAAIQSADRRAGSADRRAGSAGSEPHHAAPGPGPRPHAQHALTADSLRLEQKRRAVGQLKLVMERVLEFGVRELSKVVEDSFDDVLLELRKTAQENEELLEKLRGAAEEDRAMEVEVKGEEEEHPTSAGGVKDDKNPDQETRGAETRSTDDPASPAAISTSQDWVPVLDQVFGQKWCADIWPLKDTDGKAEPRLPSDGPIREDSAPLTTDNSQSDKPQWLQEPGLTLTFDPEQTTETSLMGDDVPLKSPSMLQRLLTLPSQLLDDKDETMESEERLLNAISLLHAGPTPHQETARADERNGAEGPPPPLEEEEEEEGHKEEAKSRSCRSGKKNHTCKTCGSKFCRAHLLKAHRLTHKETRSPFNKLNPHAAANPGKTT